MAGTCGVVGFIGKETLIKIGPAVKNKFHKLVEEIITWEKIAAEKSTVSVKEEIYYNIWLSKLRPY